MRNCRAMLRTGWRKSTQPVQGSPFFSSRNSYWETLERISDEPGPGNAAEHVESYDFSQGYVGPVFVPVSSPPEGSALSFFEPYGPLTRR